MSGVRNSSHLGIHCQKLLHKGKRLEVGSPKGSERERGSQYG